ncbi:Glutamate receptor 2, partial [Pseudolycoriella hygida]
CQVLNDGVTTIIDFTYAPWTELKELTTVWKIPYYHVDVTIGSYVAALSKYLQKKDAIDAALIFQSEKDQLESLYHLVQGSNLRTVTYNGLTYENAEKIKKLRPVPSYYGIFASSENMDEIFEKEIRLEHFNLMRKADQWNLIFLDFKTTTFESHSRYPELSTLIPSNVMCCRLTSNNEDCKCNEKSPIKTIAMRNVLNNLITTLDTSNAPVRNIKCAEQPPADNTTLLDALLNEIVESLQASLSFSVDDTDIKVYLNMTVTTEDSENLGELIQIGTVDEHQFVASTPQVIKASKRFFRVGITEAIPWTYMKTDPKTGETMIDENGNPIWEGYCIDLIARLAEDLDFDYELVVPKKGTFGKRIAFNKWDGLVGDLMTGDTDIAAAALKMTAEREEVIDFIAPYYEETGISIGKISL